VEFATLGWVGWFNNRRLLEPIGNVPPVEFEQADCQSQEAPAMVAGLKCTSLRKNRGGSVYLHAYDTVRDAQTGLERYLTFYNQGRPHSALDGNTPEEVCLSYLSGLPKAA
jgi:transposase InsO family protein